MKLKTGLLAVGLAVVVTTSIAYGVTFNETAMVDIGNNIYTVTEFADDPPLFNQIQLGFGNQGQSYQNTVTLPNGPGQPGGEVNSILVSRYLLGTRRFPGPSPTDPGDGSLGTADDFLQSFDGIRHDADGVVDPVNGIGDLTEVLLISAFRFRTTDISGTTTTVDVIEGRAGIFANPSDTFNPEDPSTWDVSGAPGTIDGLALGVFNLAPASEIISGPLGANVGTLSTNQTNVSAFDSDFSSAASGALVFSEDETVTNFLTNNFAPTDAIEDGLVIFTTQEQQTPTADVTWDATDESILNEISQWALGLDFASFSGIPTDLTDYQPDLVGPQAGIDAQFRVDADGSTTVRRDDLVVPQQSTTGLGLRDLEISPGTLQTNLTRSDVVDGVLTEDVIGQLSSEGDGANTIMFGRSTQGSQMADLVFALNPQTNSIVQIDPMSAIVVFEQSFDDLFPSDEFNLTPGGRTGGDYDFEIDRLIAVDTETGLLAVMEAIFDIDGNFTGFSALGATALSTDLPPGVDFDASAVASVPGNTDFFGVTADADGDSAFEGLFFVGDTEPSSSGFGNLTSLNGELFDAQPRDDLSGFFGSANFINTRTGQLISVPDPNNNPDAHLGPFQVIPGANAFSFVPISSDGGGVSFDTSMIGPGTGDIVGKTTFTTSTVPEPITVALGLMGLVTLGMATRRRAA